MSQSNLNSKQTPEGSRPGVSVVLPILNEERYLAGAISAILAQEYSGALEVILALGPSKDRTNEIAAQLREKDARVVLVENPSGRTAAALNLAIAASQYQIICRIDGHAEIAPTYIAQAVAVMEQTHAVNVGGIMAASGVGAFERAVATAMRSPLGVGAARFHVGGKAGPADTVYLGVFNKEALLAAGGYDERFTRAQDWELNFRLRQAGGVIWFDPDLVVTYRPRPNFRALAKQYFEYGRWRRAVSRNHKGTINFRYLAPPVTVAITALSLLLGLFVNSVLFLPAGLYLLGNLLGSFVIGKGLKEKVTLPAILATMHFSWGIGFITSPRDLI
jgi:glycosyltransferase involved in cell wall biosynthesis